MNKGIKIALYSMAVIAVVGNVLNQVLNGFTVRGVITLCVLILGTGLVILLNKENSNK